ncbi:MAG: FAD-dependent oxidoreductase [Leptospira sp.]|nr:FAD-dependent oxidoreductase [Leptospira sp.]
MNRKDFIKKIGITGSLLTLAKTSPIFGQTENHSESKTTTKSSSDKTAIVLGGGLSGLYSAYLLKQSGYKVTIVERGERLGGRIFTYVDKNLGIQQDLGGEWIGEGQSDIKTLVKQLGLTLNESPIASKFQLKSSNENSLIKISPASLETLEKVIELHKSLGESKKQGLDKINFSSYVRYQGITEDEMRSINEIYRTLVGGDLNQISSEALLNDLASQESSLRPKYYINGGAEKIIKGLTDLLGKETEISLNDPVIKVSQIKNSVQVELTSGKMIKASLLICTIPPQNILDIKWTPSLPKDMTYSSLRMQSGRISKNMAICRKKDSVTPNLLLSDTPMQALYVASDEAIGENFYALTSITNGDRATLIERSSETQKKALFKLSIQELKLSDDIPDQNFIFHSFQKLTGQRGFVSLYPPGSFGIKETWIEPYERVFFAGEHLAKHSGTMDAAIESAIQAVNRT